MMQVQNQTQQIDQTQQIAEEELLLPLSDDELASIAGGCPRPNPLDEARRQLLRRRTGLWRYP